MANPKKKTKVAKRSTKVAVVGGDMKKLNTLRANLKKIIDPHTSVNIIDMNMVQNIVVKEGKVYLEFIPTSPFCPVVNYFVEEIKKAAKNSGFSDCEVNLKI